MGAKCFAKSALRRPVWPIIRNILHPGRHKNTDMGAPSFRNILSINILNSHNAPKSLRKRRLGSNRFQKNSFLKSSKGIFSKTYCSQVISSAWAWRLQAPGRLGHSDCDALFGKFGSVRRGHSVQRRCRFDYHPLNGTRHIIC